MTGDFVDRLLGRALGHGPFIRPILKPLFDDSADLPDDEFEEHTPELLEADAVHREEPGADAESPGS